MKVAALGAGLVLAVLLAGCFSPAAREDARKYLPEEAVYYSFADFSSFVRHVDRITDELHQEILASQMPAARKQELSMMIAAVRLTLTRWGMEEGVSWGTASCRIPGEPPRFLTTRVLCAGKPDAPGLLWRMFRKDRVKIRQAFEKLPADTLAVFAAGVDVPLMTGQLREAAELFSPVGSALPIRKLADGLSGQWELLFRPGKNGTYAVLSLPDRDRTLYTLLQGVLPRQKDGSLFFPGKDSVPEIRVTESGGRMQIGIGQEGKGMAPGGELAHHPAVRKALELLPEEGSGYSYISPLCEWMLRDIPQESLRRVPRIVSVFTAEPDALILRSVSDWDPVSEAWVLPAAFLGATLLEETLSEALQEGGRMREQAKVQKGFTDCADRIRLVGEALQKYAASHQGRFPAAKDVEGLRVLLKEKLLSPEQLVCPAATGDVPAANSNAFTADNCSYVYVSGSHAGTPKDFPLVFDWPLNHRDRFQVFTTGGKVLAFEMKNLDSCRKLASFLQSRYRYPEPDFKRLLETADKLDTLFLKGKDK